MQTEVEDLRAVEDEIRAEAALLEEEAQAAEQMEHEARVRREAEARVRQRAADQRRAETLGRRQAKMARIDAWLRRELRDGPRTRGALVAAAKEAGFDIGGGDHATTLRGAIDRLDLVAVYSHLQPGMHLTLPGHFGIEWSKKSGGATEQALRERLRREAMSPTPAVAILRAVRKGGPITATHLKGIARGFRHEVDDVHYEAALSEAGLVEVVDAVGVAWFCGDGVEPPVVE